MYCNTQGRNKSEIFLFGSKVFSSAPHNSTLLGGFQIPLKVYKKPTAQKCSSNVTSFAKGILDSNPRICSSSRYDECTQLEAALAGCSDGIPCMLSSCDAARNSSVLFACQGARVSTDSSLTASERSNEKFLSASDVPCKLKVGGPFISLRSLEAIPGDRCC